MRKFKKGIAAVLSAALCMTSLPMTGMYTVMAADENLTAHYDMSHEGTSLKDVSGNGNDATLYATQDTAFAQYNGEVTMHFNKQEYATLPSGLLGANGQFTIQTVVSAPATGDNWVWCIGDGRGTWGSGNISDYIFLAANSGQSGFNNKVLSAIKVGSESSGGEKRMPATSNLGAGYSAITMVSDGTVLNVYIDGVLSSTLTHGYDVAGIYPTGDVLGYIGQSLYTPDAYLNANVADIKIWNAALSADEVAAEVPTAEAEMAMIMADIVPTLLNGNASLDKIESDVAFPATIDGIAMTWTVPENDVIAQDGTVTVPVGDNVTVDVAVSFTYDGEVKEDSYTLTVLGDNAENIMQSAYDELDIPNKDDVRGNITLPAEIGNGVQVTWETSHPEIVDIEAHANEGYDSTPAGTVTRPAEDTEVTMTATLSRDGYTMTKEFVLNVIAAPEEKTAEDYTDYFFAYFAGEGYSDGEQMYFAASQDGLNWTDLNENNPILTSSLGEKGIRDPYIIRSPEGDKFYIIATDLKIYNGNGWTAAQTAGSQSIMVWESTDLVNWSEQRMVEVSASIDAGCTWAPETYYDEITGEYIVFWASKVAADNYGKHKVYYAKTRDFYSFTEPEVFVEYNQSSIDTTVIYDETTDMYYRYTKNEGGSTNELGALTKTVFAEKSATLLGEWEHIPSDTLNDNQWVEGPAIFKFNVDDNDGSYCLLVDDFGGIGYYPLVTDDLSTGVFSTPSDSYKMPTRARHGTAIPVTAEEYEAVMDAYGPYKELLANFPTNLQYFIDCNNPNSDYYAILDQYADLLNETPDQAYVEGSWGYVVNGTYGAYDGNDRYQAGWWARSGQSINYKVPLEAGTYNVTFGLREWWNVNRPMTISMTANGTTTTLGNVNSKTSDGTNKSETTYTITLEEAADVTFTVAKAGSSDPVLSFIQIQHVLDLEALDAAIAAAEAADRTQYTEEELAAIDAATAAGKDLRLKAVTTQEQADAGAEAILAALDKSEEPIELPYIDVAEDAWYYWAVADLYEKQIMMGTTETTFAPDETLTRAQFAAILYRMAGSESVAYAQNFDDVSESDWFADAVTWAYENNIIVGYGAGNTFGPYDNINREQMAVMMYRFAEQMGYDTAVTADLTAYADAEDVSDYAETEMKWAVGAELIAGSDGKLAPQESAIRAQAAAVAARFLEKYAA